MPNGDIYKPEKLIQGRPFTDPKHSLEDQARLRFMAHQLVDTYDDPVVCDFTPRKRAVCQSDPQGRHFRIYYIQPKLLFTLKMITVVGFFGQKRPGADVRHLLQADKKFEAEFSHHPGLLSLSTVRLRDGDFANLVLFTDPEARDKWNYTPLHRDLVAKISPPYYQSIRLNNGTLPDGLAAPDNLVLEKVRYLDYHTDPLWRGVRDLRG
jgi:hypothetical protein